MAAHTGTRAAPLIAFGGIADEATNMIREMILDGRLQPGEWLRQAELARVLGVSAMPVREALRALQSEGLVLFYPCRGAMVTRFSIAQDIERDMIMEELEVLACRWLAEDFGRLPLDDMRQALAKLEEAEQGQDINARLKAVRAFKYDLYQATQKPYLLEMINHLFDLGVRWRRTFSGVAELRPARVEAYRNILHACEDRDEAALIAATRALYALARKAVVAERQAEESRLEASKRIDCAKTDSARLTGRRRLETRAPGD